MSRLIVYPTLDEYEARLPVMADRLSGLNADALKKMARVWVGKEAYKLNKESAIKTLQRCFRDPMAVRQLAQNLTAAERDGLMLMKLRGRGVVYTEELALELLMMHPPATDGHNSYYSSNGKHYVRLNEMIERGLLMRCVGGKEGIGGYYSSSVCEAVGIVADFFDVIEITPPPALRLKPVDGAFAYEARRPGEVLLQLTSFHHAFDRLGGLQLTAKGQFANTSLAKLRKLLSWGIQGGRATPLPDAIEFYLGLFLAADLLRVNYEAREITIHPRAEIRAVLEHPVAIQARLWGQAYRSIRRWKEVEPSGPSYYYEDEKLGQTRYNGLRAALSLALGMLPDPSAWYRIEDLSENIRQRIGGRFSLGYQYSYSSPWNATPEQAAAARAKYEKELVGNWRKTEGVWIERALSGPLFHLGLVELGSAAESRSDLLDLFRLSEAGRAAFYDIFRQPSRARVAAKAVAPVEGPCWIVQPNFEVIVYLDQASPRRLGFIERIGLRQKADAAIAGYRLTRESIYAALEDGIDAQQLLRTLASGALHPLPPGVERTLSDWAARRERLAVRLNASVLEFSDAGMRDEALAKGEVKGAAIGDRFILTEQSEQALKRALPLGGAILYEPQPPRSLIIGDDGILRIDAAKRDLLIESELAAMAEPAGKPLCWRITCASVSAARARGWVSKEIIDRLDQRAGLAIPSFLRYAIQGWCGDRDGSGPAALSAAPLLQTMKAEVMEAILNCSFLRPHLLARIGACAALVKPESFKLLGKLLKEYGFEVGKEILLPAPVQPEKKK
ncbi:MAG: helicase-associated domain-containing protein [Chloracidobacterium sp.]|nr:helicase-associated domain-containing protein [Chloracidobacterium sp.]